MTSKNDAARRAAGPDIAENCSPDCIDLGHVLPRGYDHDAALVLAGLLFQPDQIGPHLNRVRLSMFSLPLYWQMARGCLWYIGGQGRADVDSMMRVLVEAGERAELVDKALRELRLVAHVLNPARVAAAVERLCGRYAV